jgi:hypothetical protein
VSLAEFFDYLITHDASRKLGLSLAATYAVRDPSVSPKGPARTT